MADEAAAKDPSATASASSEHMFDAVAAGNLVEVFPRPLSCPCPMVKYGGRSGGDCASTRECVCDEPFWGQLGSQMTASRDCRPAARVAPSPQS